MSWPTLHDQLTCSSHFATCSTNAETQPCIRIPTAGVGEVLEKFSDVEFTCEYKYDGERAQIHVMDGGKKIMIFSR